MIIIIIITITIIINNNKNNININNINIIMNNYIIENYNIQWKVYFSSCPLLRVFASHECLHPSSVCIPRVFASCYVNTKHPFSISFIR